MSETYDCIVVGVGGFGSGALYHLAKRGAKVLGLERFGIAHDRGSSHGETRIIRKAYFEHPDYVPLLHTAYELWRRLEQETEQSLCHLCGLMLAGPPDGEAIAGARRSAERHGIPIDNVSLAEARRRFLGFRFRLDFEVVYEAGAGYLDVEPCVAAHIRQAQSHGATLRTFEPVVEWQSQAGRVRVRTERTEYEAASLVFAAGAWTSQLLSDLNVSLDVLRKPVFWHEATSDVYNIGRGVPAFLFEMPTGVFYGFPSLDGRSVKVAEHSGGRIVSDPLTVDRSTSPGDFQTVSDFVREVLPEVRSEPARHSICMYTMTPDRHFIVDRHPHFENVILAAGFSGHGFKFTTVLGQALADLALDGDSALPIGFLRLNRDGLRAVSDQSLES